ncbi:MAG: ABC transporter permease [Bacteroidota bacterium]
MREAMKTSIRKKTGYSGVTHQWFTNGVADGHDASSPGAIGPDLKSDFSEVLSYVRLFKGMDATVLANKDVLFEEDKVFFATEDFFKIFSYEFIRGVDSLSLREPLTMVMSQSMATRYFGNEDPSGKTLKRNGKEEYQVVGEFLKTFLKILTLNSMPCFLLQVI